MILVILVGDIIGKVSYKRVNEFGKKRGIFFICCENFSFIIYGYMLGEIFIRVRGVFFIYVLSILRKFCLVSDMRY